MHIQPHSQTRNQGRRGEASPSPFENQKKALIESIFGINFLFKMQFYKYLREKAPKFFPAGPLFLLLSKKSLLKCTSSTPHPPPNPQPLPKSCPEKFLAIHLHSNIILFAKSSTLMFDSVCSVICTVTLCYVLHQTHSELQYIQCCFLDIHHHIQGILRHIQHPV